MQSIKCCSSAEHTSSCSNSSDRTGRGSSAASTTFYRQLAYIKPIRQPLNGPTWSSDTSLPASIPAHRPFWPLLAWATWD
jgi:hypothetical protein